MNEREAAILRLLRERGAVSASELASVFAVSEMTIRRDLGNMAMRGLLVRTRGGCAASPVTDHSRSVSNAGDESHMKALIGMAAAALVKPKQTVMVDCGSTVLEVARHLPEDAAISVVTTSLCVAEELHGTSIEVVLLGGLLRSRFPSVCGPLTEMLLGDLHADWLFVGCDGASSTDGFYMYDVNVSSLEQSMIRIADRVVVVTESDKFGRHSFARYATPREVHFVVTDDGLSATDRSQLERQGVKVVIAGEAQEEDEE